MKKNFVKKIIGTLLTTILCVGMVTGCGANNGDADKDVSTGEGDKQVSLASISVISREDGSGTRDAFTELVGIMEDDVDNTTVMAEITNSTSVMMTTVAGNEDAIGYVSLGSLNDSVKAISVDGVEPTTSNISDGLYKIARPFHIVTKETVSDVAQDFIDFILSTDGQKIIEKEGYIKVESQKDYSAKGLEGKVTMAGSTSVAPVMEILAEEYMKWNENVTIEIQQTGSGAGITSTIEGVCDIGMSSRDLKDTEIEQGVSATKIAMDGIAVIVNLDNTITNLTSEQIKEIFVGNLTKWSEVQ